MKVMRSQDANKDVKKTEEAMATTKMMKTTTGKDAKAEDAQDDVTKVTKGRRCPR